MYIFQLERKLLKDLIKQNSHFIKGKVLDVGSGTHRRYQSLFVDVNEYITLDVNTESGCDIVADCRDIPVDNDSFDSIVCTQVLGDIPNLGDVVSEFHRILKSKGYLLLSESFFNELHSEPYDFWRFTPYTFQAIFPSNQWEIVKIDRVGGFWSVLAQLVARYFILRFNLYKSMFVGRIFSFINTLISYVVLFFDRIDKTLANRKFCLGYVVIIKKL